MKKNRMNIPAQCLSEQVSVIIRSAGERTENACKESVLAQGVPEENVTVIRKAPFTATLQASYEAGRRFNLPWTYCVDADVLLLPGSIKNMLALAERQNPAMLEIQGRVLDKFLGGPREAGNHLYRTSLLDQAMEHLPLEQDVIRPEWHTLDAMKKHGYPSMSVSSLVGIHDFEQYYRDIFRKCFIQAHKHLFYAEIFLSYWPKKAREDLDYDVALKAFIEGVQYDGNVQIDIRQEFYKEYFDKLNMAEKAELDTESYSPSDVEQLVKDWIVPQEYNLYFWKGKKPPETHESYLLTRRERVVEQIKIMGLFKFFLFSVGWGLEKAGGWIKGLVNSK